MCLKEVKCNRKVTKSDNFFCKAVEYYESRWFSVVTSKHCHFKVCEGKEFEKHKKTSLLETLSVQL